MIKLSKFEKSVVILCAAMIAAHFIASFFPEKRLWGIDHLAYIVSLFGLIFL